MGGVIVCPVSLMYIYGNWSAVNSAEQVWCIIYMLLLNIVAVKNDETTGWCHEEEVSGLAV
jgi:hypothetical protein